MSGTRSARACRPVARLRAFVVPGELVNEAAYCSTMTDPITAQAIELAPGDTIDGSGRIEEVSILPVSDTLELTFVNGSTATYPCGQVVTFTPLGYRTDEAKKRLGL